MSSFDGHKKTIQRKDDVINNLMKMLELGSSNDVTIQLIDGDIKANKDVLIASSDYFATMFSNDAYNECKNGVVPMKDVKKVVMEGLVTFMFSGELDLEKFDILHLLELMNLAQFMLLDGLFKDIESYIEQNLHELVATAKIAFEGLPLIYKFNLTNIKLLFTALISASSFLMLDEAEGAAMFFKLPINIVKDLMDWKSGSMASPIVRFKAFDLWFHEENYAIAAEEQKMILDCFDLKDFTAKDLVDHVRKTGFYEDEEIDDRLSYLLDQHEEEVNDIKEIFNMERSFAENEISELKKQLQEEREISASWKEKYEREKERLRRVPTRIRNRARQIGGSSLEQLMEASSASFGRPSQLEEVHVPIWD